MYIKYMKNKRYCPTNSSPKHCHQQNNHLLYFYSEFQLVILVLNCYTDIKSGALLAFSNSPFSVGNALSIHYPEGEDAANRRHSTISLTGFCEAPCKVCDSSFFLCGMRNASELKNEFAKGFIYWAKNISCCCRH